MFRTFLLRLLLAAAVTVGGVVLALIVNQVMQNSTISDPLFVLSEIAGGAVAAWAVGMLLYGLAGMADRKTDHLQR